MKNKNSISISILDIEDDKLEVFLINLRNIVDKNKYNNVIIHFDVMDGVFVKNLGISLDKIALVKKYNFFVDVHLMVAEPEEYIEKAFKLGANIITVHCEIRDIDDIMYKLYSLKNIENSKDFFIGLAISPDSDISKIYKYNNIVDMCLVMSVYPGLGNQQFLDSTYDKIKNIRHDFDIIEIDGGVNESNIIKLKEMGINSFVLGSYFTKHLDELEKRLKIINKII